MRPIRLLALDIDGVLTDGTASLSPGNAESKRICFQDLDAVAAVRQAGVELALVTGEDNALVDSVAARFGITRVRRGAKDKLASLHELAGELGLPLAAVCYVGDGDRDAPALAQVGLGLAPADATPAARAAAHRVLQACGGHGAVAEAVRLLGQLQEQKTSNPKLEAGLHRSITDSITAHQKLLSKSLPDLVAVAGELTRALAAGRKILLFGNGGSAAAAQLVAAELVGRFSRDRQPWPAIALSTDAAVLTCVGNDWDFDQVFARQVRALARPGDVAVGISTSSCSACVRLGLEAARACGAFTIGFTGQDARDFSPLCELCFCAPAASPPRVQELHLLAWHAICECVEAALASTGSA